MAERQRLSELLFAYVEAILAYERGAGDYPDNRYRAERAMRALAARLDALDTAHEREEGATDD